MLLSRGFKFKVDTYHHCQHLSSIFDGEILVKFPFQYELNKEKLCKDSFLTDTRDYIPRISLFFKISK